MDRKDFEVIIIGGSYAGLSAAMALGRSLRTVLIVDSGTPCNMQTPHSHNFLTQDGETPSRIAQKAKEQVLNYKTVSWMNGRAIHGSQGVNDFEITLQSGQVFTGDKIIFATGIKDIMPPIPGFAECWGISVIHCPYCHGFEFRNQRTAIIANAERAFHLASLINNLTDNLTILTSGDTHFDMDQMARLQEHGIFIIAKEITEMNHLDGYIHSMTFSDSSRLEVDAVYAGLPFEQQSDLPFLLGCEFSESGHIKIDTFQRTSVKGIYACGDNSTMMRSVANAVYTGNFVGAMVNKELTDEKF